MTSRTRSQLRSALTAALLLLLPLGPAEIAQAAQKAKAKAPARSAAAFDEALFQELPWREVGPYRGGRSAAVAGVPSQPLVYYFGSTGGGVWKTTDGGANWKNVSDGFFGGSIGAVAVAPSNPNVAYVGGGEKTLRGNVSHGDGMWRSEDAGKTWKQIGLADSRHVSRIRIHPQDPDQAWVAAIGHAFGPNPERGVFRTRDGGKSWERVLFVSPDVGAVDLILDPGNPRVLYASTWRVRRYPWGFSSGGPGSGLWKSADGGDTWRELSRPALKNGLPEGTLGIIGVAVSPSNPQNVYAVVEAEQGGVFRSRDGGETWEKVNESRDLRQRAWYYTRVYADPMDEDTVYVLNVRFHKSKDGGKTFSNIRVPHGDNHDLWIAPDDPLRMIESNDGGANVSFDGGATWTGQDNQPTAQLYRVTTDNDFPYRILGAQQDNTAVRIRHRSLGGGIGPGDWEVTAGGESGHIVAHPKRPDLVYGGSYGGYLTMVDHETEEFRDVNPWPDNPMGWGAAELTHRFQWNFPILFSPHEPHALYAAAEVLFRSTDGGASWTTISPDLTRNDKSKMGPSGGPITKDNTSVEYYGTIFAVAESPLSAGVLWAGSDDGLVHVSKDGGKTWTNVTPKGMPEWIQVNSIEASPYEAGGAYVAATMYKHDDFRPYLYRTADFGATWTKIDRGIPDGHFTRVVRADPARRGLLYAGTERGVYVSFDDGGAWQSLQGKLPVVPVTDLAVKDDDLIAATQGRGFWSLDDLTPLHQLEGDALARPFHLFAPRAAWRLQGGGGWWPVSNQGTNPPAGVVVTYHLKDPKPGTELALAFLGPDGSVLRELKGKVEKPGEKPEARPRREGEELAEEAPSVGSEPASGPGAGTPAGQAGEKAEAEEVEPEKKEDEDEPKLPAAPGWNRFAWDLRLPKAEDFEGMILWGGGTDGPRVPPGRYQARLTVGGESATVPVEVKADPRAKASPQDLEAQYAFLKEARDKLSEVNLAVGRIRDARAQLEGLRGRLPKGDEGKPLRQAAKDLDKKITGIEEALYQTKNKSPQDPLNFPIRLNDKLAAVAESAATGDFAPTAQARAVKTELTAAIDAQLGKLREVWEQDLPALNKMVDEKGVPAVRVKEE